MWAGCGTPATGAAMAAGDEGLALADGTLELTDAPWDGPDDAQPAMARASSAPDAATNGDLLIPDSMPGDCLCRRETASAISCDPANVTGPVEARSLFDGLASERIRVRAGPLATVQGADRLDVLAGQLEVEDVDVLPDPRRGHRLGENNVAALDVPAEHHLGGRLAVPAGNVRDSRVR